jgi:hypothetical protein
VEYEPPPPAPPSLGVMIRRKPKHILKKWASTKEMCVGFLSMPERRQ